MIIILLKISAILLSLIAWLGLCSTGFIILKYPYKRISDPILTGILFVLLFLCTYNSFYEGITLFQGISLIPAPNLWTMTLLPPLIFLYIKKKASGKNIHIKDAARHFIFPVLLFLFYIVNVFAQKNEDRIIYAWSDIIYRTGDWWIIFRFTCLALFLVECIFYIPYIIKLCKRFPDRSPEINIVSILSIVIFFELVTILSVSYIPEIFYNISLMGLCIYLIIKVTPHSQNSDLKIPVISDHRVVISEKKNYNYVTDNLTEAIKTSLEKLMNESCLYRNPEITISQLASLLATNETYLSRYLNNHLGKSFPEWINHFRIKEAEKLLEDKHLTTLEISEKVGFQSLSTFYHLFKAKHGIPPAQWRREHNRK